MRDWHTSTEADAAKAARAAAYPDWQDERDEPGIGEADHNCRDIPFPGDCWGCVAFVRAAELAEEREAERVRQEVIRERNAEWWAS